MAVAVVAIAVMTIWSKAQTTEEEGTLEQVEEEQAEEQWNLASRTSWLRASGRVTKRAWKVDERLQSTKILWLLPGFCAVFAIVLPNIKDPSRKRKSCQQKFELSPTSCEVQNG